MKTRNTAIALSLALLLTPIASQRANSQAAAAVIGEGAIIVILGGAAYYYWVNSQGQDEYAPAPLPIEDPEEAAERMGNSASQGKVVKARTASEAQSRCESYAGDRVTDTPEYLGNNSWRCRYH
jgi:hypothetical protein